MKFVRGNAVPIGWGILVVLLWVFPSFWYTRTESGQGQQWFEERTEVHGWRFEEVPVAESAERVLVADTVFNGEFVNDETGQKVMAFSARRLKEDMNEIGLFVHTPDRCWTEAGWKIVPVQPETTTIELGGREIVFERRVFDFRGQKELVYFSGLIGGQTLPYRLDHNLSVAMRYQLNKESGAVAGTSARSHDERFWKRIWESFTSRRKITGSKQFIRVSVPVQGEADDEDRVLADFVRQWLG
jgi:hypothetical protein